MISISLASFDGNVLSFESPSAETVRDMIHQIGAESSISLDINIGEIALHIMSTSSDRVCLCGFPMMGYLLDRTQSSRLFVEAYYTGAPRIDVSLSETVTKSEAIDVAVFFLAHKSFPETCEWGYDLISD